MKAFAAIFAHLFIMAAFVLSIWHWSHGGKLGAWPMLGVSVVYIAAFIRYGCATH